MVCVSERVVCVRVGETESGVCVRESCVSERVVCERESGMCVRESGM